MSDLTLWWCGFALMSLAVVLFGVIRNIPIPLILFGFGWLLVGDSENNLAKKAGFLSEADREAALDAGLTDPVKWAPIRRQRAEQENREQRERDTVDARKAGFENVDEYLKAKRLGYKTGAAYRQYLYRRSFVVPPSDQANFISEIRSARKIGLDALGRSRRKEGICRSIGDRRVKDWNGAIKGFETSWTGWGILKVDLGHRITLQTNIDGMSDYYKETLIDPASPMFKRVSRAKVGDRIKFSGNFFQDETDCIEERSVTTVGSMIEPEFVFRFTTVDTRKNDDPHR